MEVSAFEGNVVEALSDPNVCYDTSMAVAAIKSVAPGLVGVLRKSSCRVSFLAFSMICLKSARA